MSNVLIHGVVGGREVAIAQAMENSPEVRSSGGRVFMDNGDILAGKDAFAGSGEKPLVIIGPEKPLVDGIADELRDEGYLVFGANKEAAQYEASKAKTVRMARQTGIVHPQTFIFDGPGMFRNALGYAERTDPLSYVIKADGLAGGKGVVLPDSTQEAVETVKDMATGNKFGNAGAETILFARRKEGPEVSVLTLVGSGSNNFLVLPLTQDHKRLLDNDQGPNTGGMGAYGPVPETIINSTQLDRIIEKVHNMLDGIKSIDGVVYDRGAFYPGLMKSKDLNGERTDDTDLIEINVRLGDPETQPVLALLQAAGIDCYWLFRSAAEGHLEVPEADFSNLGYHALSVCLAAEGYGYQDRNLQKGDIVHGLDHTADYKGVRIQRAATLNDNSIIRTNGGRILYVTAVGETIDQAAERAYAAIGLHAIHFENMQYRKDIGWQARQEWQVA